MTPHGNALRMKLALSQLGLREAPLHIIPLLPEPTSTAPLLVTGIASTATIDLTHTRFLPRCFPLPTTYPPLLLRHDMNQIAGSILGLRYDHMGRLLINAELTHPLAKRMAAFSVGVTVADYVLNKDGACVTNGTLEEISVTDRPANPECLITHRYPPSANVEFYNIIERGAQLIYKIAEVVVHQVVQAQRPKDGAPSPVVHRPPTQFSQLVTAMQEAHP